MKTPRQYNITPAKGQALLNFQGRRFPDKIDVFETELIEEVRSPKLKKQELFDKETDLNADFTNLLIQGDCLSACAYLKQQNIRVDLVYIDPPFASGANYAKKIYLRNGGESVEADDNTIGEEVMYGDIWQKEDYLNWLYERLLAIKDVMNETGSIYVHLDWHIGHYVKILLDEVFGEESFVSDIVWRKLTAAKSQSDFFSNVKDSIFFYKCGEETVFNPVYIQGNSDDSNYPYIEENTGRKYGSFDFSQSGQGPTRKFGEKLLAPPAGKHWIWSQDKINTGIKEGRIIFTKNGIPRVKRYLDEKEGNYLGDLWIDDEVKPLSANSSERENYNTQKPAALLERVIRASSDKGLIVADFFSGSGTTAKVANDLNRKFIACDIGINAVQTTRDRLVKAGASFDILKIKDGLRLFRNPAQTTAKIFGIIDGFKSRADLDLNEFWDGGIAQAKGTYTPVKFSGIHDKLTRELLDVYLEEIYKLEDVTNKANEIIIIYAHKDLEVNQEYLNKQLNKTAKTELKVKLVSLDELLGEKRDALFTPDNAIVKVTKQGGKYKVEIKNFFSSYLKNKIDEFNAKKTKKGTLQQDLSKAVKLSSSGLELIESVQFDTTLGKVWKSNPDLEDKAGIKEKIKGVYALDTDKFRLKIRNIAGDETIIDSKQL
ncbi:DNA adenine methyltransferase YhdJ [Limihaloglobus sulfuriphilus]|uniref:site-specific DNA-methyltransferase (adenine-specific) n=1 Tax=Limihaloglobus sulfuriphilus TaxID=1851148 RepID=A0A1Q2MGM6_9BACT|nr:site-specific DNA-methyltransferase [Limihaloglobus sulfuriphilus]AQQ71841.1 DNA adenine methyltransferase YhdJ [Limihaloglobus sulfuriphilus]